MTNQAKAESNYITSCFNAFNNPNIYLETQLHAGTHWYISISFIWEREKLLREGRYIDASQYSIDYYCGVGNT